LNGSRSSTATGGIQSKIGQEEKKVAEKSFVSSGYLTGTLDHRGKEGGGRMLYYALVFLLVGLVAAALGLAGVAGVAIQISWILFVIGIVLLVIHLLRGHTPPVT
jgi:uncharacterized membrane protein YtjA (UPF0391 family)